MARLWPILAIAAGAVVLAVFLFGGDDVGPGSLDDDESYLEDEERNPELMASEAVRRKKEADAEAARRAAEAARNRPPPDTGDVLFLQGVVLSAQTGRALPGARLYAQEAGEPCPRLPRPDVAISLSGTVHRHVRGSALSPSEITAGSDGRFTWRVDAATATLYPYDVFVQARGHVMQVLCRPVLGGEVKVLMPKALQLQVRVTDRHGRPVQGAQVHVEPGPDTPAVPGHAGFATSDQEGRGTVDGLRPGTVLVKADHPGFMPSEAVELDPSAQQEVELRLPPAMRFTFTIRSDDASAIENVTLLWRTDGVPPREQLLLLPVTSSGPEDALTSEVKSQAVRVPCEHRHVQLELKADGFAPWRPAPEPLPPEGGEKDVIAVLVRDTSLASLRVSFEDEEGQAVSFASTNGVPAIQRLDPKDPGPVVVESGSDLVFPALPAGPYRVGMRCAQYAPVEQDVEVFAGQENQVTVKLRPPAKLRVRFLSDRQVVVRFRLRRDGRILPAFPVDEEGAAKTTTGLEPLVAQGEDGALFSGLDTGAATIEVTSPELVAEARSVQLREGETTEVEIEVRER